MIANANALNLPIAANSVDLIFTDPPYHKATIHVYEWLAAEAARILKPGGFCLAMNGGYYLFDVMTMMAKHLEWFWNYEVFMTDVSTVIWPKRTIARNKPIIALRKGAGMPRANVLSGLYGGGNDKRYHRWGQDVESARYFIDCFSKPGDLVLDPFVGGGTTAVACQLIGRRCVGMDADFKACQSTVERINGGDVHNQLPLLAGVS